MNDVKLLPGMVVRTKNIRAIIGEDDGYLEFKPNNRKEQMHFLFLGIDSIKGTDKLDPIKILQILGWDPSPELKAQIEEDKKNAERKPNT